MDTSKLYRITSAAEKCGTIKQTLSAAIRRGDLPAYFTACGLPLVKLEDVRRYLADPPKRGRKPHPNTKGK